MKRIIVLGMLAALFAGAVVAVKFLPWWALVGGAVLLAVAGKWALKKLLRKAFIAPFKMKGAALKGATVEVLSLSAAPVPSPAEGGDTVAPAPGWSFYWLEVAVRPTATPGPFQHWEPGELRLVKPESQLNPESDEADDEDYSCTVRELLVEQEGKFAPDEGMKFPGEQKLRMLLAVAPGVSRLKWRYYFEELGEFTLPAPAASKAA